MNMEIESQLRDYLVKNILYVEEGGGLADDASFLAGGVMDSIGITELVEYVQSQFGFEVPLRDVTPANFDSIAQLAGYVRRRLAEGTKQSPEKPAGAELTLKSNESVDANACAGSGDPACKLT